MNTKIFIYSMHYIPNVNGIPDVMCKPVLNKARLYGAKARIVDVVDEKGKAKPYVTIKRSKDESMMVKGKLYEFGPTAFKAFEKVLFRKFPKLIRTFCVVMDKQGNEYKAVTYLLDNS